MSNLELTIYAVAAVFLVGVWFLLGKLGKLVEWVFKRLLPETKKQAAGVVIGAVMAGVYFWFGGSVLVLGAVLAVLALADWGLTRWGVSGGVKNAAKWAAVAVVPLAVAFWPADKPAVEVAQAVPAAVAVADDAEKMPGMVACPCNTGSWCQGPRGGVYCMSGDGKKRYRK